MDKILKRFFDFSKIEIKLIRNTGIKMYRECVGILHFYPTEVNLFMEDVNKVKIYDNGDMVCDDKMSKLVDYLNIHNEFMDYCLNLYEKKTRVRILPLYLTMYGEDKFTQVYRYKNLYDKMMEEFKASQ
jgi:hypothetical protein